LIIQDETKTAAFTPDNIGDFLASEEAPFRRTD